MIEARNHQVEDLMARFGDMLRLSAERDGGDRTRRRNREAGRGVTRLERMRQKIAVARTWEEDIQ
jgi:hypothetical protein